MAQDFLMIMGTANRWTTWQRAREFNSQENWETRRYTGSQITQRDEAEARPKKVRVPGSKDTTNNRCYVSRGGNCDKNCTEGREHRDWGRQ